jgi:hypothetical protein
VSDGDGHMVSFLTSRADLTWARNRQNTAIHVQTAAISVPVPANRHRWGNLFLNSDLCLQPCDRRPESVLRCATGAAKWTHIHGL